MEKNEKGELLISDDFIYQVYLNNCSKAMLLSLSKSSVIDVDGYFDGITKRATNRETETSIARWVGLRSGYREHMFGDASILSKEKLLELIAALNK